MGVIFAKDDGVASDFAQEFDFRHGSAQIDPC